MKEVHKYRCQKFRFVGAVLFLACLKSSKQATDEENSIRVAGIEMQSCGRI